MNSSERSSISESIHLIFDWIRHRRPGPATLDWLVADPPAPIVIDLTFPTMHLTDEEERFIPSHERVYSMNGNTPGTLRNFERALTRLTPIGGELSLERHEGAGMSVRIAIPAEPSDFDVADRINFIKQEIQREIESSS